MDLHLKGKVAIVTGGSRGIGKAIARALAQEGVDIAIVGRNLDAAKQTAADIAKETRQTVDAYAADTALDAAVSAAVTAIAADFGRIDILVNCAAQVLGSGKPAALAEITDDLFWSDVNVKVMGYLRMAREVAPHMKRQGWGRIINISGLAARQTGSIVGTIRNIGVAALTKNLGDELGPSGINVTCVHPAVTRTEKTPAMIARRAEAEGVSPEVMEKRVADASSIRHLVTAEEVADIVAFLASPKSIAINGDAIAAGGGTPGAIYY